ncbi:MAG: hypothetical protein GXO23_05485 [Crenarchaeota archaeon]|nr:hypothetical protein [Thermoproteota archaeon]
MAIEEIANRYFTKDDPVKTVASYMALLTLRFERRSNYEKVINIEEITRPLKRDIEIMLGPTASYRAYITATEFLEQLFSQDPTILEAERRFKVLERIESEKYNVIRRHYLTIVEANMSNVDRKIRIILYRALNDIRYGKIYTIDRTCAGSCYISKIDLLSKYLKNDLNIINEFSENLSKIGILKSTYLRVIVPAPILEESFIRRVVERKELRKLIDGIDTTLLLLGFSKEDITTVGNINIIQYVKNIQGCIRYRIRLIITERLEKNIEKYLNNIGNIFNIIITRQIESDSVKRMFEERGVPVIVDERLDSKYVSERIVSILLEVSSLEYLKNLKDLLEDLLGTLL